LWIVDHPLRDLRDPYLHRPADRRKSISAIIHVSNFAGRGEDVARLGVECLLQDALGRDRLVLKTRVSTLKLRVWAESGEPWDSSILRFDRQCS
jgi:hypothetical protein